MKQAAVTFIQVDQKKHNVNDRDANTNILTAVLPLVVEYEGKRYEGLSVRVTQPYGSQFEAEPLEVGRVEGKLPVQLSHDQMSDAADDYYRHYFGSTGSAIGFSGGGSILMQDNAVTGPGAQKTYLVDVLDESAGW